MKTIAIIAKKLRTGSEFLIKLLNTIPYNKVKTIRKQGIWPYILELDDGTSYVVIHPGERGRRWNKAFVQRSLSEDEEFMTYVVKAGFINEFDIEYFD